MTSQRNLLGTGTPGAQAQAINGTFASGLVATGSTQGTALLLQSDINAVATTAASTGVILNPATVPGDDCLVYNGGANALLVYPPVGMGINNGALNAGFSVATTKSARFSAVSTTQIIANLSA